MLLIPCPYCGKRPEIEFRNGGEAHIARPPRPFEVSDEAWEQYLFVRSNPKGQHYERWRHIHGCSRFFNVLRNTVTDRIEASYEIGQPRPTPRTEDAS
jgi:sarcosine oxidase subunit delta